MSLLLFLKNEWKPCCVLLAVLVVFYCGYHLRTLQYEAAAAESIQNQSKFNNTAATNYERAVAKINAKTDAINLEATRNYAKTVNRCFISADSLRLIQAANY